MASSDGLVTAPLQLERRKQLAQPLIATMGADLRRRDGDAQGLCDLLERQVVHLVQHDRLALLERQAHESVLNDPRRRWIARIGRRRRGAARRIPVGEILSTAAPPPQSVPPGVRGDGEHPGPHGGARLVAPPGADDGEKRHLQKILRQRCVAHHPREKGQDRRA